MLVLNFSSSKSYEEKLTHVYDSVYKFKNLVFILEYLKTFVLKK